MSPWNDTHYARAQEFTRLLAEALAAAAPDTDHTAAPFVSSRPPALGSPVASPAPVAPAAPSSGAPPMNTPAGPATAASVFKKIPWKK